MSGLSEVPDYNKQTISDRPVGAIFEENPARKPNYGKQGNANAIEADDLELETRRGRVQREPSGATSARSGSSVSRDRSNRHLRDTEGSGEGRNASMSPSRAMGARSISIDRTNARQYSGLNTLEGLGSSMSPQVNPAALESRGRTGFRPDEDRKSREPSREDGSFRQRLGSPTGARSVSRSRQPPIAEEGQQQASK